MLGVPAGRQAENARAVTRSQRLAPKVGIIYLVGDKLWIDATPLAEAGRFSDFAIHERDHSQYWPQLVRSGVVSVAEYEEYPRGRVAYNDEDRQVHAPRRPLHFAQEESRQSNFEADAPSGAWHPSWHGLSIPVFSLLGAQSLSR